MRKLAVALAAVAGAGLALSLAFTLDQRAHAGEVARNVTLQGDPIGGLNTHDLLLRAEDLSAEALTTTIAIPDSFDFRAEDIELQLDVDETLAAVMRAGRQPNLVTRLASWALSPVLPRDAGVVVSADHDAIYALVAERDPNRTAPTEPTIAGSDSGVVVVPGKPGEGIDAADVIDSLNPAAREGFPLRLEVFPGEVAPRHTLSQARNAADLAESLTAGALTLAVANAEETVEPDTVRSWLTTAGSSAALQPVFDDTKALASLEEIFEGIGRDPVDARFTIGAGGVNLVAGRDGTRCCAPEAVDRLEDAILRRVAGTDLPMQVGPLPLTPVPPERGVAEARALNIVEQVGGFTTPHKAGEPRVQNIHRIADLMRGQIIEPGESISVNGIIGKRTTERGFVSAPQIQDGNFGEGIGGGISQFATTLFNAAFFAGLEFPEYQSHSIYISRYPYGREATLSFPKPDLRIRNPTPHGILIWTSYTDTSISVSLWSTKHSESVQSGQTTSPRGPCTFVRTDRTRTYLDGSKKSDRVNALYRPGEGVNC